MQKKISFIIILLLYSINSLANIKLIRWADHKHKTRIVVEMDKAYDYQLVMQDNKLKLSIPTNVDHLTNLPANIKKHNLILNSYEINALSHQTLINFYTKFPIIYRKFMIAPRNSYGYRLVIDLKSPNNIITTKPEFIIMLDPGHGGKDRGAKGNKLGTIEKQLTLNFAQKLAKKLKKIPHYKVHLTRTEDKFIHTNKRRQMAELKQANLLISLHADFHHNPQLKGLSVYSLGEPSDAEAAIITLQNNDNENKSSTHVDNHVTNIIQDMIAIQNHNLSAIFAENIVKTFTKNTDMLKNSHRFANLRILRSRQLPSILIELGYLSNYKEEKLLNSDIYQEKLTNNLVNAINLYYDEHFTKLTR